MNIEEYKNLEQGSDAWKAARLGHITASNIDNVMAKGKGNAESITRNKYKMRLVAERLTNQSIESFTSAAMEWGVEQEQFACMAYEIKQNTLVERTGFWLHPTIKWIGVSPDRLVGEKGILEAKCPQTTTHLDYIFADKMPAEYVKQVQCQLWVTGREWCDFISFDPRLPQKNQLFVKRVERDEELIKEMEQESIKFLAEVESLIMELGA